MRVKGIFDVGLKGAKDEKVAEYALKHKMVILTLDAEEFQQKLVIMAKKKIRIID